MKQSKKLILSVVGALLISPFFLHFNVVGNLWGLFTEQVNFIPKESSIFTFNPYVINQGSSNYWLYGEDSNNYYYFSYEKDHPYDYINKENKCVNFDKYDHTTWCS